MRSALVTVLAVVLLVLLCQSQNPRSIPSPMRHAQELQAQNEMPHAFSRAVDPSAVRGEAEQLSSLAASIPSDIQNANKGLMSKDLILKLKQIEKLSKHLRGELAKPGR